MIDLADKLESYFQVDQSMKKAVSNYCLDHFADGNIKPYDWIYSFSVEIEKGKKVIIVHWEEDSYCSCCPNIYGEDEIPMEDLMPYLESQYELDEFDRKLETHNNKEEKNND